MKDEYHVEALPPDNKYLCRPYYGILINIAFNNAERYGDREQTVN